MMTDSSKRNSMHDADLQVAINRRRYLPGSLATSANSLQDRQRVGLSGSRPNSGHSKKNHDKQRRSSISDKSKQRRGSIQSVSPPVEILGGFSMENQFKKKDPVKIDASVSPYRHLGAKPTMDNATGDGIFKAMKDDSAKETKTTKDPISFASRANLHKKNAELRHTLMSGAGLFKGKIGQSIHQIKSGKRGNAIRGGRSKP